MSLALPTGRLGQALALGLALLLAAVLWIGVADPLLAWHAERSETLSQRRVLAQHMAQIAATLPSVQHEAEAVAVSGPPPDAVIEGATDAVAGAALQQLLQDMAAKDGATLSSTETLPAEQAGAYRRIGLRVSATAPWPVLARLLQSIEQATPRMLIDDLQVHGARILIRPADLPLDASWTVLAFRADVPQAGAPQAAGQ